MTQEDVNNPNKVDFPGGQSSDAVDREKIYQEIQAAIKTGNMRQAHHLLLTMIPVDGLKQEFWLLLAWTAPSRREAEEYYEHLLSIYPDYPLAMCGVAWNGSEWATTAGVQSGSSKADQLPAADKTTSRRTQDQKPVASPAMSTPIERQPERNPVQRSDSVAQALDNLPVSYPFLDEDRNGTGSFFSRFVAGLAGIALPAFLGLYLLGITLAEAATTYLSPQLGLVIHGVLLLFSLGYAILEKGINRKGLLLSLSLVPLMRVISLSVPGLGLGLPAWYALVGLPVLLAAVVVQRLSGYSAGQAGLTLGKHRVLQIGIGLAGLGIGFLEYLILKPAPMAANLSLGSIWLPALILLIFTGFLEEFILRGMMQHAAGSVLNRFTPWYIALIFAILHIAQRSWIGLVMAFGMGLFFSLIVKHTHSLLGVTLSRALANIGLFLIFPFILAGPAQSSGSPPAYQGQVYGPALWSSPANIALFPAVVPRPSPTSTATAPPPTATLTLVSVTKSSATLTQTLTPQSTLTASLTSTPWPSFTITPTLSPTPSPTSTLTATITLLPTARATPIPTRTATDIPAQPPTATKTLVPSPTATLEPTPTETRDEPIEPPAPTETPTQELPVEPAAIP